MTEFKNKNETFDYEKTTAGSRLLMHLEILKKNQRKYGKEMQHKADIKLITYYPKGKL